MHAEGYEQLGRVLRMAFAQAAHGKGADRHANGRPFHEQPMMTITRVRGIGFPLGQADKKTQEAATLHAIGAHDKAVFELLGAIVYIAGAVLELERVRDATTPEPEIPGLDEKRPASAHYRGAPIYVDAAPPTSEFTYEARIDYKGETFTAHGFTDRDAVNRVVEAVRAYERKKAEEAGAAFSSDMREQHGIVYGFDQTNGRHWASLILPGVGKCIGAGTSSEAAFDYLRRVAVYGVEL